MNSADASPSDLERAWPRRWRPPTRCIATQQGLRCTWPAHHDGSSLGFHYDGDEIQRWVEPGSFAETTLARVADQPRKTVR